jgi:ankyrin repeat protein
MGRTILHEVVEQGNEEMIRELLRWDKMDPNLWDEDRGWTPLHFAIALALPAVVGALLENKRVEVNATDQYGRTALNQLCRWIWSERFPCETELIIKLLLNREDIKADQPDKDNETPLFRAATGMFGSEPIVRLLLARGDVNPSHRTLFGATPILVAAFLGRERIVRLLLDHKDVDPDSQTTNGDTPLLAAPSRERPENGSFEVVRLLLARADVNGRHRNSDGRDAFFHAGQSGSVPMMKMLLDEYRLFDPNLQDSKGQTVLHHQRGERPQY